MHAIRSNFAAIRATVFSKS